jgi:hypothetical protein
MVINFNYKDLYQILIILIIKIQLLILFIYLENNDNYSN